LQGINFECVQKQGPWLPVLRQLPDFITSSVACP
jgi:hypothetical protein